MDRLRTRARARVRPRPRMFGHTLLRALLLTAALDACSDDARTPADGSAGMLAHAGEGGSTAGADAGVVGSDAGAVAADVPPGVLCSGELPVMTVLDTDTNTEHEPDWSCYAQPETPAQAQGSRQVTLSLAMSVPALIGSIDGLMVDVFFGPSTLGKPAVSAQLRTGQTSLMLDVPADVTGLSAHVHALTAADARFNTAEVRDYDLRIPSGGVIEGTTVLTAMHSLAANVALDGDAPDASKASLGSEVRDCLGHDVGGAQFELIDGETNQPVPTSTTGSLPRAAYSQFALPNPSCTFTTVGRAEWMLLNAPVNVSGDKITHPYRLRLKGRMHASDVEPVVLGEHDVELFPGSITAVRLYKQAEACAVISGTVQRCR